MDEPLDASCPGTAVPWASGGTGAPWLRLFPGTLAIVATMHAALVSAVVVVAVVVIIGGADESPSQDLGCSGRSIGRPRLGATGDNGDSVEGTLGGV